MKLFNKKVIKREESIFVDKPGYESPKEAVNRLKDNVLYAAVDGDKKVIQFESSVSGEAKTTTVVNLAVSLGETGKKVLVIDLDFRKPRIHRAFKLENVDGISDYMLEKIDMDKLIKKTTYENVDFINRGSEVQNPTAILTSDKMTKLVGDLRSQYDFILLDCPPVLIISDYINIARLSDGVIFNIAYGMTKKNQVKEAIGLLKKNSIDIIGAVFTFYDPKKANNYGDYNYYSYYSSNYGDKK